MGGVGFPLPVAKTTNSLRKIIFLCVIIPRPNHMYHLTELVHEYGIQPIIICQLGDNFFELCMAHKCFDVKMVTLHT